jgi:hypothetical protein
MVTIGLVACSKRKLDHPAPARELYTSPLFRAASAYCERTYDRWLILSALYGLVEPDQVIEPYDVTLRGMTARERWVWIREVGDGPLADVVNRAGYEGLGAVYLHAGLLYRAAFQRDKIMVPLAGLGIGQQLAWYKARTVDARPATPPASRPAGPPAARTSGGAVSRKSRSYGRHWSGSRVY